MGKGQQQRILFGFGLRGWYTGWYGRAGTCSVTSVLPRSLFENSMLSFPEMVPVFLRNNGAAKCMQKNDLSGAVPIHFWILNSHIFFSFWISLMKEGPEHLDVLSGEMTFLLFTGVCLSTVRPWLFFSFPLLYSKPCYWTEGAAMPDTWQSQAWRWRVWATFNIGILYPFRHDN